jgi:hypothetical protein
MRKMTKTEGWVNFVNTRKFHYVGKDGRSYCMKYLYLGSTYLDVEPDLEKENDYDPLFCKACQKLWLQGGEHNPPGNPSPHCEACGRFVGYDGYHGQRPTYWEWEYYWLCKRCKEESDERERQRAEGIQG